MVIPTRCVRYLGSALFSGYLLGFILIPTIAIEAKPDAQTELADSPKAIVDEAWQIVQKNYIDTTFNQVDWVAQRKTLLNRNYSDHQQAYAAIRNSLQRLNDPYTRFLTPEQLEGLTQQTSGKISGIGVMLVNENRTKKPVILKILPNSPASRSTLKAGDYIVAVDGRNTEGLSAESVASLMKGEANSNIRLTIERQGGKPFNLNLLRGIIELQQVSYKVRKDFNSRIGYIKLDEFTSHSAEQVENAIKQLSTQKVDAFILDLRGNPGGLLDSSIDITRMWLNKGLIVRTQERNGKSEQVFANNSAITQLPLAVLVDQNSASSSEILTGALQDNKRAVVVGTKTFGKALVQSVHELADGSGLTVTIAHYYTPSGIDISRKGIQPDIVVTLSQLDSLKLQANTKLLSTNADPQYQRAIDELRTQIFGSPQNSSSFRQTVLKSK